MPTLPSLRVPIKGSLGMDVQSPSSDKQTSSELTANAQTAAETHRRHVCQRCSRSFRTAYNAVPSQHFFCFSKKEKEALQKKAAKQQQNAAAQAAAEEHQRSTCAPPSHEDTNVPQQTLEHLVSDALLAAVHKLAAHDQVKALHLSRLSMTYKIERPVWRLESANKDRFDDARVQTREECLRRLCVNPSRGLGHVEVLQRRGVYGPNVKRSKRQTQGTDLPPTQTVLRSRQWQAVATEDLVPGDVLHLKAGGMVPANVRILAAQDLWGRSPGGLLERYVEAAAQHDSAPSKLVPSASDTSLDTDGDTDSEFSFNPHEEAFPERVESIDSVSSARSATLATSKAAFSAATDTATASAGTKLVRGEAVALVVAPATTSSKSGCAIM